MIKNISLFAILIIAIIIVNCDSPTEPNKNILTSKNQLLGKWSDEFQNNEHYNLFLEFKENDSVSLITAADGFIDSMELPFKVIDNDFFIYESIDDTTITYRYSFVSTYDNYLEFTLIDTEGEDAPFTFKKVNNFPTFNKNWESHSIESAFKTYTEEQLKKDHIYNSTLLIDAPDYNFFWKGSSGNFNNNKKMKPDDLFRIASIGKTVTASTVLLLKEEGKLNLNDTILKFLPDSLLDSIHIYNNISYGSQITIKQLLQHTSGIADYLDEEFAQFILSIPNTHYTIYDILKWTENNKSSSFPPGQGFQYSDVNFLLLGLIIERIEEKAFNEIIKERIFTPLEMSNTFLEGYDLPPNDFSNTYYDSINIHDFDFSFDWSAGGLISNTEDLNKFLRSITKGSLFKESNTKDILQEWIETDIYNSMYGCGMEIYGFSLGRIFELIGHTGAFSSIMLYLPDYNISICGTINQFNSNETEFIIGILNIINQKILNTRNFKNNSTSSLIKKFHILNN